ncbi:hypothetical protein [Borrelia persica]|uniref:hypothetical protein n=1 Tax=Borrelia persica TaxID=44448 RepID=UPI0004B8697F|nr:hypothetical protein [Borrelia persica]
MKLKYCILIIVLVISILIVKCPLGRGGSSNADDSSQYVDLKVLSELDKKSSSTALEAYSALRKSLTDLKDSYGYTPQGFDETQFDSIFPWESTTEKVKYGIYSILNRDIKTLNNLKVIVANLLKSPDQNIQSVASNLFVALWDISGSIYSVVDRRGRILNDANLVKIKNSDDIKGLDGIRFALEDMLKYKEELVILLKDIINSAANFGIDSLEHIANRLIPITILTLDFEQHKCNAGRICVINNELKNLVIQIDNSVSELKKVK